MVLSFAYGNNIKNQFLDTALLYVYAIMNAIDNMIMFCNQSGAKRNINPHLWRMNWPAI